MLNKSFYNICSGKVGELMNVSAFHPHLQTSSKTCIIVTPATRDRNAAGS